MPAVLALVVARAELAVLPVLGAPRVAVPDASPVLGVPRAAEPDALQAPVVPQAAEPDAVQVLDVPQAAEPVVLQVPDVLQAPGALLAEVPDEPPVSGRLQAAARGEFPPQAVVEQPPAAVRDGPRGAALRLVAQAEPPVPGAMPGLVDLAPAAPAGQPAPASLSAAHSAFPAQVLQRVGLRPASLRPEASPQALYNS